MDEKTVKSFERLKSWEQSRIRGLEDMARFLNGVSPPSPYIYRKWI